MSSNILVKTIEEVSYFNKRIFIDITLKQKCVYLILTNEPILDITLLREFLIERELNHFGTQEIHKLISLIDSFFNHKINYDLLDVSNLYYNYEYPNKGKGFGTGKLCYLLNVTNNLLVVKEADFNKKEPMFSSMKFLDYQRISSILFEIKELFKGFLDEPNQTETNKPKDKTKEFWFKIGLSFATGEAQKQWRIKNISFEAIATNLGFKKTDKTYFSNTLQNTNNQKNIYNDIDKMKLLFDYCKKEKINMCNDFINKYNELQAKNV